MTILLLTAIKLIVWPGIYTLIRGSMNHHDLTLV